MSQPQPQPRSQSWFTLPWLCGALIMDRRKSTTLRAASVVLCITVAIVISGCDSGAAPTSPTALPPTPTQGAVQATSTSVLPPATPTAVSTSTPIPIPRTDRKFVPILSYHHIRNWVKSDGTEDRAYIIPPDTFRETLNYLKENGYQSVSSEQVYNYYSGGKPLPDKPIMLSFDDNNGTQYTGALPLLKKYGFKGTFFIMTVTIGKENYMSAEQLKELDQEGHDLQPHTWDHHMVTQYETDDEWQLQIEGPKKELEALLGHPTPYFAYPFGIYSAQAAEKIKSYGYKVAFRLSENMDAATDPLFAIKRYIANPYFTDEQFKLVLLGEW